MTAFNKYSLSVVLASLWLVNWGMYAVSLAFRPEGFEWQTFWEGTFENNSSEFLQLFGMVVLTALLIHQGSPQSKDGQERLEKKVDAIALDIEEIKRSRS